MMNITNSAYAGIVYLVIVALIAGPVIYRLVGNLVRGYKLRQQIKNTPGPLLGVIYPELFNKLEDKETK